MGPCLTVSLRQHGFLVYQSTALSSVFNATPAMHDVDVALQHSRYSFNYINASCAWQFCDVA